jgi:hypothetical protein
MTLMPSSAGFYGLVLLCAVGVVATFFVMRQRLPLKLQRFKGREHLTLEQMHDTFYPDYEMETFISLWREIASAVEVPPGLIRPADRFDGELGPVKGFEVASEMDGLLEALVLHCKQEHLDFRKVVVKTVDDYIRLFARKGQ